METGVSMSPKFKGWLRKSCKFYLIFCLKYSVQFKIFQRWAHSWSCRHVLRHSEQLREVPTNFCQGVDRISIWATRQNSNYDIFFNWNDFWGEWAVWWHLKTYPNYTEWVVCFYFWNESRNRKQSNEWEQQHWEGMCWGLYIIHQKGLAEFSRLGELVQIFILYIIMDKIYNILKDLEDETSLDGYMCQGRKFKIYLVWFQAAFMAFLMSKVYTSIW